LARHQKVSDFAVKPILCEAMTTFQFLSVPTHPLLSPYIAKMYVFESSGRLPADDKKLIVPNANLKLTCTWRNGIVARVGDQTFIQKENKLSLTGLIDTPVNLNPEEDAQTGTIIIEFNPLGAYRFFSFSYADVKNQIVALPDLIGQPAEDLESRLAEAGSPEMKLQLLQHFLIKQLEKSAADPIYDFCIQRISHSKGLITVSELERKTGYSARWLNKKFTEHLGTGPKNLSEIVRFKEFYQDYSTGIKMGKFKSYMYDYYYDQSHFIRAFKRFTGFIPSDLQGSVNELATRHFTS
jgi:AraC-like DNA-binding protein